ncbi:MAG: hypothetical protein HDQ98_08345 [Lachnospiraceae bacterium]|nr:hypothetical protein [Lachnospiraceae bacterium]
MRDLLHFTPNEEWGKRLKNQRFFKSEQVRFANIALMPKFAGDWQHGGFV